MCVPAGLLAITTAIVLYANSTVTKREKKMYVHNIHPLKQCNESLIQCKA